MGLETLATDIKWIKEWMIRLEKKFDKKADRRVQYSMTVIITTLWVTAIWAVFAKVVAMFN